MASPQNVDLTEDRLFPVASGIISCAVCAPRSWACDRIEKGVNEMSPTGISSRWSIPDPSPHNPAPFHETSSIPCPDDPGRLHWLLLC